MHPWCIPFLIWNQSIFLCTTVIFSNLWGVILCRKHPVRSGNIFSSGYQSYSLQWCPYISWMHHSVIAGLTIVDILVGGAGPQLSWPLDCDSYIGFGCTRGQGKYHHDLLCIQGCWPLIWSSSPHHNLLFSALLFLQNTHYHMPSYYLLGLFFHQYFHDKVPQGGRKSVKVF